MPWKKFSVLEARVQFVLALKNKSESFASVCGRFGISRKSGYKWWQRYRAGGLKALGNASRRPRHRGKMHRFIWRMRLCKLRQEHPRWGAKKLRRLLKRAFPPSPARSGGEHLGALAGGAAFGEEAQAPGAARTGIAEEGSTRSKRLQPSVDNRLQRLVSHGRWTTLRAADSARSFQSLCAFGGALAQPKRYRCAPSSGAGFSSLRSAQSDPGGQWRALWWQRRSGVVALERVVVALGHHGGVCPASSPRGQRCARTNASGLQSRCSHSTRTQRSGTEKTHPSLDRLLTITSVRTKPWASACPRRCIGRAVGPCRSSCQN